MTSVDTEAELLHNVIIRHRFSLITPAFLDRSVRNFTLGTQMGRFPGNFARAMVKDVQMAQENELFCQGDDASEMLFLISRFA